MKEIKILLIDHAHLIREALKNLLESEENFQVVADASDLLECENILKERSPDFILYHFNMDKDQEMEFLLKIIDQYSLIKILILYDSFHTWFLQHSVLHQRFSAYISTQEKFSEIKELIYRIWKGQSDIIVEGKFFDQSKINVREEDQIKIQSLTKREMDILKNVALGMYNKEIALKFEISERTVKNHLSNIFKKISVSDRTQAAVFAIKNHLVNIYG
ncbi:MAG: response regulator transcription factor [Eubacterium sp.]|nr:response regulator transcription factor [Eubacterium sp.]